MAKRSVEINLPDECWARIDRVATAAGFRTWNQFVANLLDHVQQGVYRSGAWERDWLLMVVGLDAITEAYEPSEDGAYRGRGDESVTPEE